MTEEMLKSLPYGTRLNGVGLYGGPDLNEQGTYMGFDRWAERAIVEWDNYIIDRHTCGAKVKDLHSDRFFAGRDSHRPAIIILFSGNKNMSKSSEFSLQNVTSGRPSTRKYKKVADTNGFLPSGL